MYWQFGTCHSVHRKIREQFCAVSFFPFTFMEISKTKLRSCQICKASNFTYLRLLKLLNIYFNFVCAHMSAGAHGGQERAVGLL